MLKISNIGYADEVGDKGKPSSVVTTYWVCPILNLIAHIAYYSRKRRKT